MLEYFSYKKVRKHQAEKRAREHAQTPVLSEEDANFLERIVSTEGTPPPLPERPHGLGMEAGDPTGNTSQMVVHDGVEQEKQQDVKGKGKESGKANEKDAKKSNRMSFLQRTFTKKDKNKTGLEPAPVVPLAEAEVEESDINRVLDELNLAAVNNKAFSFSKESQDLMQKFTVILKDLVNGVPTAYDDLVHLLDDSQGTLAKSYDHLPSYLQKLITSLPNKLTSTLAPELLAVATEAQAFNVAGASASSAGGGGIAGAAKRFLTPTSLKDLVTKPGAVASLLKAIMNALKLRWPAFMGTNVLLSLGLFVLLFVFWYCHKRGREVRLEKEKTVDSNGRIIEVDDDPMLGEAGATDPSRTGTTGTSHIQHSHHQSHHDRDAEEGHSSSHDHTHGNTGTGVAIPERRPVSSRGSAGPESEMAMAGERRSTERR